MSEAEGEYFHSSLKRKKHTNLKKLNPNACQWVSKPHMKKLAKSRMQFLSANFYVPESPCVYIYNTYIYIYTYIYIHNNGLYARGIPCL